MNKKEKGFTLAEVLISLVIIGVVAAITVPTLMNNTHSQEFRSAIKKAIASLNLALAMHYAQGGTAVKEHETAEELVNHVFKQRMTNVDTGRNGKFTNEEICDGPSFAVADGSTYCITNWYTDVSDNSQTGICNTYNTTPCTEVASLPNVYIDVNGDRKPNRLTTSANQPRDIYEAQIYNQRVVPFGDATQQIMYDKQVKTL